MPCGNSSFERPGNRWNRVAGFRLPVKACRRPNELWVPFYFLLRFKDFVTNHEHGRVKSAKVQNSKIKLTRGLSPGSFCAQEEISAGAQFFWLERLDFPA